MLDITKIMIYLMDKDPDLFRRLLTLDIIKYDIKK